MRSVLLGLVLVAACGSDDEAPFPENYEETLYEARDPCRKSHDHELRFVRVFADDLAFEPYTQIAEELPYPEGALLLKAEYDDEQCEELLGFTTMQKLAEGASPTTHDWRWESWDESRKLDSDPRLVPDRCVDCHECHCGEQPYGWDLSCAQGVEPPSCR